MTLPYGYVERSGRLALNVKVHRGPTAEELASVAEECGADPVRFAHYFESCAGNGGSDYCALEDFARTDAFDRATEDARELFGQGVKCYSEGRSGGWLVLHGKAAPDASDLREAQETFDAGETELAEPGEHLLTRLTEARDLLSALEKFAEWCHASVADFPRAVAWLVCANGFLPAEEKRQADERKLAVDERLALATLTLRQCADDVCSERVRYFEGFAVLGAALSEYDAARAALDGLNPRTLSQDEACQ